MAGTWPAEPVVYELNTAAWLHDVGVRAGARATLGSVSDEEWDAVTPAGVDAVWLMGVWQRSPVGVELARPNEEASWHEVLPDLTDADVIGSAYCIRAYVVDDRFGGRDGLAAARAALAARASGSSSTSCRTTSPRIIRGSSSTLTASSKGLLTRWRRTLRRSSRWVRRSSPVGAIRTSLRGPTSPSSTRSPRRCVAP